MMDAGSGFWIFIAAIVVAGIWKETRERAEKHETLRRIVEKTGTLDEAKLKELFSEPPSKEFSSYRALRIAGTVVLFAGAGLATFFLIAAGLGNVFGRVIDWWYGGVAVAVGIAILGLGIFFSSRFCEPPER
jgi:hypothetical protein